MQSPTIVFDHVKHEVVTLAGRDTDGKLAEMVEAQRKQIATSGRPGK